MNGAIAEPCVATNAAPNNAIVIIIGASQNFLRLRRNDQNSKMNVSIRLSYLVNSRRALLRWSSEPGR
jgi:hypothetical protein